MQALSMLIKSLWVHMSFTHVDWEIFFSMVSCLPSALTPFLSPLLQGSLTPQRRWILLYNTEQKPEQALFSSCSYHSTVQEQTHWPDITLTIITHNISMYLPFKKFKFKCNYSIVLSLSLINIMSFKLAYG